MENNVVGFAGRRVKVCFVQPVQSPYWTERLKVLARHADLDISLLLERKRFEHRVGWHPEAIENVHTEVLGSSSYPLVQDGSDLGYQIQGMRLIPWRLAKALYRIRPEVLVLCNATQLLLALSVRWKCQFKVALIVEDTPHATRNRRLLARRLRSWAYRRADSCFAFSKDATTYLQSIGIQGRIFRSSWSLNMEDFRRSALPVPATARTMTVLFVGQFVPRKGVLLLLDAWQQVDERIRSRCRLLLVGDGPQRSQMEYELRKQSTAQVEILGQLPYARVRELLCSSDLFVLPTLEDLFSLTVLEAMACGCPVITTPFNGARELVKENQTGWIVDPTKPGALATVLQRALSEQVDLEAMGRAARTHVEPMDNVKVMADFRRDILDMVAMR